MWHGRGRVEEDTGFWWGNLMEGDQLEDLGGAEGVILKWMVKIWDRDVDWIDLY